MESYSYHRVCHTCYYQALSTDIADPSLPKELLCSLSKEQGKAGRKSVSHAEGSTALCVTIQYCSLVSGHGNEQTSLYWTVAVERRRPFRPRSMNDSARNSHEEWHGHESVASRIRCKKSRLSLWPCK